eukprot:1293341-Ditylum_brightwellii.AAC.1
MDMTSYYDGKVGSTNIFTGQLHLYCCAIVAIATATIAAATVTTAATTTSTLIFAAITTSITFYSSN